MTPSSLIPNFARLSDSVHYRKATRASSEAPTLLILCAWMDAPIKLVQKYAAHYLVVCPDTDILLVTSSLSSVFVASETTLDKSLRPAVSVILDYAFPNNSAENANAPRSIIGAAYSNGGVKGLNHIAKLYKQATSQPLPISNLLIDSAPGNTEIAGGHGAVMASIPLSWRNILPVRILLSSLIWLFMFLFVAYFRITRTEDVITKLRRGLVDPQLLKGGGRRLYIFSKQDKIVPWRGVLESAETSRETGWVVQLEEFKESRHVAHAMTDRNRYWDLVRTLVDGRSEPPVKKD